MSPVITSGIDLVEISRFKRLSPGIRDRFFLRVFTEKERELIGSSFERAAGIFAVKEAVSKALGCGIGPVSWQDIEVTYNEEWKPELHLQGNAKTMSENEHIQNWSISISHIKDIAAAIAVASVNAEE